MKKITVIAIVAILLSLILSVVAIVKTSPKANLTAGAAGGLLAENYIPYVMYNDGYKSAKDVETSADLQTTGTLTIGTSGTAATGINFSTCTPTFSSADQLATTTVIGICTDSTFTTSDKVLVNQKMTTATGLGTQGLFPSFGIVATTSGQFGLLVFNNTGAATTSINSSVYRTYSYELLR